MRKLTQNLFDKIRETRLAKVASGGALVLGAGLANAASAVDAVTIPTTGLDIAGYVTAAITAVAAVFSVVVGGYFAFLIVKKGMRWAGRALG